MIDLQILEADVAEGCSHLDFTRPSSMQHSYLWLVSVFETFERFDGD